MSENIPQGRLDFGACYRMTYTDVERYLIKLTSDKEIARDLAQDTFERAFRNITSFREGANFRNWAYTIATNVAGDYFRKKKVRQNFLETLAEESTLITPEDEAIGRETERKLNDFLSNYKSQEAVRAFILDLEELSDEEISNRQGIHIKALKSRLHTIRRQALEYL